ncbi:transporter substrate-binding domain-containing protein [Desulfocurvus sp. DL9XJH121]
MMQRIFSGLAAVLLAAAVLAPACASAASADRKVIFAFDRKFIPLSYVRNAVPTGFEVEILEALLKGTGLGIDYKPSRDWSRAQAELSGGIVQVASGMTRTDLREQLFLFPDTPTLTLDLRFFVNRISKFRSVGEIRGQTVAAIRDSLYQRLLQDFGGIKIKLYETGEEALDAVVAGDAQAYFGAEKIARDIIARKNLQNLQILGPVVRSVPVYFALYKGEKQLRDLLGRRLRELMATGEYDRIYRKWFVPELSSAEMKDFVGKAMKNLPMAYAPHSQKPEAAAVLTRGGLVYLGASVDSALGQGVPALEMALSKAVDAGDLAVRAVVRVNAAGRVLPPSARERELLWEFGRGVLALMELNKGEYEAWSLSRLLPLPAGVPGVD